MNTVLYESEYILPAMCRQLREFRRGPVLVEKCLAALALRMIMTAFAQILI